MEHQQTHEYSFTYPSVIESEAVMFDDLSRVIAEQTLGERLTNQIKLCVSEAFSNALVHGNKLDPSKKVYLKISANTERFTADICDEGADGLHKALSRKPARKLDEGGRGIDLMQGAASEVTIEAEEHGGLRVSLSFETDSLQDETSGAATKANS